MVNRLRGGRFPRCRETLLPKAHAVTMGEAPSLEWFQAIANGKSRLKKAALVIDTAQLTTRFITEQFWNDKGHVHFVAQVQAVNRFFQILG